ncbi:hypothetical protein PhaeoP18_01727 [Phaeobacter piscinae]|uniref:Uncharacterized protein n=1 Tax=Phaeobacter piscinae TaxID=1580596 RepID=A0AAN1LAL9_9RHOB|nr:hypothetical protein PhaeoP13_01683 [Phaeobacter piscinae]AUR35997.1 hypothetical protein PhaeoP18_01727 [Phaeobacter piscinae]
MRVAPIRLPRRLVLGLPALPVLASWLPRSRGLVQAGLVETATVVAALDPSIIFWPSSALHDFAKIWFTSAEPAPHRVIAPENPHRQGLSGNGACPFGGNLYMGASFRDIFDPRRLS